MTDLSNEFINKVFEDAQNDSSLLDTIDINEIIAMSENENMDYINEKTMNDILNEIYEALKDLNIELKFDIVLNHLSVASPQFKDLIKNGKLITFEKGT